MLDCFMLRNERYWFLFPNTPVQERHDEGAHRQHIEKRSRRVGIFPLRTQLLPIAGQHRPILGRAVDWRGEAPEHDELADEQQECNQCKSKGRARAPRRYAP